MPPWWIARTTKWLLPSGWFRVERRVWCDGKRMSMSAHIFVKSHKELFLDQLNIRTKGL
jgi:hypothetical protein